MKQKIILIRSPQATPIHYGGRNYLTLLHLKHVSPAPPPLGLKNGEKEVQTLLLSTHSGENGRWQAVNPKPALTSGGVCLVTTTSYSFIRNGQGGTS